MVGIKLFREGTNFVVSVINKSTVGTITKVIIYQEGGNGFKILKSEIARECPLAIYQVF